MKEFEIKIGTAVLWTVNYLMIMVFYTLVDAILWEGLFPNISSWLNVITMTLCIGVFLFLLGKMGYRVRLMANVTPVGILLAVGCAALFFVLLDNCLDPIFERVFPTSEQDYQDLVKSLLQSPVASLLQVCILAPVIEEILMRGFVLGGLKKSCGTATALLVSASLFAILHFNMVQTLSAFICGLILGLLYVKTESILCCIIAHCGYNLISFVVMVYPYAVG